MGICTASAYVNTEEFECWWYQGGGIYRDVHLTISEPVCIDLWGVYAPYKKIDDNTWQINYETAVLNTGYENCEVEVESSLLDKNGDIVVSAIGSGFVNKKDKSNINYSAVVKNPLLWDCDNPNLYTIKTVLKKNDEIIDENTTRIGFRTIEISVENGLLLNGKKTFINGVCAHQDFGLTGLAVPENIAKYNNPLYLPYCLRQVFLYAFRFDAYFKTVKIERKVMDRLCEYHSLDIQWGNHDVLWMGASAGQTACIANIVRTSLLYDNVSVLENGYGISILPLLFFAMKTYKDDTCKQFKIRSKNSDDSEISLEMKAHKAISVIQFKLEGQLISEHPEYNMEHRRLLHKIDFANGTVKLYGKSYKLCDGNFPTVNPDSPYELTEEEKEVVRKLRYAFVSCEKLKKHINLLLNKGSLYKVTNGNILFHGCIPMTENGDFREINVFGRPLCGKALYDELESCARKAFLSVNEAERKKGRDILWFLWNGADSPLYGRDKMTTFERYFISDESTHTETKDIYYKLINREETAEKIFAEFGVKGENRQIINGHVPIHHTEGETPVKCGGRVIIIDGGFASPYHKVTGIAGYTLIFNSYGLMLTAHEPFQSVGEAIKNGADMQTHGVASQRCKKRILVGDTDNGAKIKETINDLKELISAYRSGEVRQDKHKI